jgi:hypothetical protein
MRRCAVSEKRKADMSEIQEILTRFWDQLIAQPSARIDPGVRYPPYSQHTFERKIESKMMP